MMKRILVFALFVSLLVGISSIGVAEEQIVLRVSWWGSQGRHDRTLAAIDCSNRSILTSPLNLNLPAGKTIGKELRLRLPAETYLMYFNRICSTSTCTAAAACCWI